MAVTLTANVASTGPRIPAAFDYNPSDERDFTVARIEADGGTVGDADILLRWITDSINDGSYRYITFDGSPIVGYKLVSGYVEKVYSIGRNPIDAIRDIAGGSASVPLDTTSFPYPIVQVDAAHTFRIPAAPRGQMKSTQAVDGNAPAYNAGVFIDTVTSNIRQQFFAGASISSLDTNTGGRKDSCSLQGVPGFTFAALDSAFGVIDPVRQRLLVGKNGVIGNQALRIPLAFTSGSGDIVIAASGSVFKWVELAFLYGMPDLAPVKGRSLSGRHRDRS